MKAYVELIQRRERDIGCDVLTHQTVRPLSLSVCAQLTKADLPLPFRARARSGPAQSLSTAC